MIAVTDTTFEDEVLLAKEPVVVIFGSSQCPACRAIQPDAEEIASAYQGTVKVVSADVEHAVRAAQANGIRGSHALMSFRGGHVIDVHIGGIGPAQLRDFVAQQVD